MPYSTGGVTKNTFRYGPEVHKLHLEFQVKSGDSVHRGQPVFLNADGTISPAVADTDEYLIIGVSIHELESAYSPDKGAAALNLVVVAMRGYTVTDSVSAVVGVVTTDPDVPAVAAGPVEYIGYVEPASASNVDDMAVPGTKVSVNTSDPETLGSNGYTVAADAAGAIGWSITPTVAAVSVAGQATGTIYGGHPILVVIKD